MVRIYKYKIGPDKLSEYVGRFAVILKVDWQGDDLCVWCLIDDSFPESKIKFHIIPTGYEFELKSTMKYVDTIQDGPYVWHVFYELLERGKQKFN